MTNFNYLIKKQEQCSVCLKAIYFLSFAMPLICNSAPLVFVEETIQERYMDFKKICPIISYNCILLFFFMAFFFREGIYLTRYESDLYFY